MFTKKQKFLPPEEWVMFKDETGEIVPAIVSEELWDKANVILRRRSEDVKARQGICNHANLLTGKLFCMDCGTAYYRRESKDRSGNKNSKWICSGKIKGGSDSCASFAIYEEEIKPVLFEVFRDTKANADALVEEYLRDYAEMTDNGKLPKRIKELEKKIDFALQKKAKLLEFNVAGKITDRDFFEMTVLMKPHSTGMISLTITRPTEVSTKWRTPKPFSSTSSTMTFTGACTSTRFSLKAMRASSGP